MVTIVGNYYYTEGRYLMIRRIKRRISALIFLTIFVLLFTAENTALVSVQLLHWQVNIPLAVIVFSMLLIGFVIGRISQDIKFSNM